MVLRFGGGERRGRNQPDRIPCRASPCGCAVRPPVRGAGSPRLAGAAGRWGPGRPCWASTAHPERTAQPFLACAWHVPCASALSRTPAAPAAAPRTPGRSRGSKSEGGREGGAGAWGRGYMELGRGVGLRAPSPPVATATTAGLRAGGGRSVCGVLSSLQGNYTRPRNSWNLILKCQGRWGRSGGRGIAAAPLVPAGGAPGPGQIPS